MRPLVTVGCALAALLAIVTITWPLATRFTTDYAGHHGDQCVALWDVWWTGQVVLHGQPPLFTDKLFFPDGTGLSFHSISWLSGLMALPLRLLGGPIVGYNLLVLLQAGLCVGTMALWLRERGHRVGAALFGGLVFALSPVRMDEAAAHPNLAGTCFVPLAFMAWERGVRSGARRDALWLAAALALTLLTGAHLFVMTGISLGLFALLQAVQQGRLQQPAFWRFTASAAALSLLACAVPLWQFIGHLDQAGEALGIARHVGRGVDPKALLVPPPSHPLLGALGDALGGPRDWRAYLGLLPMALGIAALCQGGIARRQLRPFALTFGLLLLLSLGAELQLSGEATGITLPYAWLSTLSPVRALRHPDRLLLVAFVPLSVLAAAGFDARVPHGKRGAFITALLLLGLVGEYRGRDYPTRNRDADPVYAALPADDRALLELPLSRERAKHAMCQQVHHGRPLVGGMIARPTRDTFRYILQHPLLSKLSGKRPKRRRCPVDARAGWQSLADDGVGYVLVKRRYEKRHRKVLADYFGDARPIAASGDRIAYAVDDLVKAAPPCQ